MFAAGSRAGQATTSCTVQAAHQMVINVENAKQKLPCNPKPYTLIHGSFNYFRFPQCGWASKASQTEKRIRDASNLQAP